jgi:hypothetical protein
VLTSYSASLPFAYVSYAFLICLDVGLVSFLQGDDELAIDVMDRLSPSILESFIHLTGADQVTGEFPLHLILGLKAGEYTPTSVRMRKCVSLTNATSHKVFLKHPKSFKVHVLTPWLVLIAIKK